MPKHKAILIFGPPGVGKGTQAKELAKTKKYLHFSSGDMVRNLNPNTKIGSKIKSIIDKGEFVPDNLTFKLFDETIQNLIQEKNFSPKNQTLILDGIPRNVKQVPFINKRVNVKKIIYLDAPDNVLIKRISNRASNEERPDDQRDIFKKRLSIYRSATLPILKKYNSKLIIRIDGTPSIEQISKEIKKVL